MGWGVQQLGWGKNILRYHPSARDKSLCVTDKKKLGTQNNKTMAPKSI
jgi:hypothetical protein